MAVKVKEENLSSEVVLVAYERAKENKKPKAVLWILVGTVLLVVIFAYLMRGKIKKQMEQRLHPLIAKPVDQ